ncbi:penicillin-binding protein 1A [Thermocrinis sp.]
MRKVLLFLASFSITFFILSTLYLLALSFNLPSPRVLKDWKTPQATIIYDYKGRPFGDIALQRRYYVSLEHIPIHVRYAFISAEDKNFYWHPGVDPVAIGRALIANIYARDIKQGASTITQQLAKNLFLTPEKSLSRKIREAILALKIEREFSKDKILEMYLNYIYLGQGAYGVEAASKIYFGKSVKELTLDEAAVLASLPKAPTKYNPFRNPDRILERRNYILRRMLEDGYITQAEYEEYSQKPLRIKSENRYYGMDYFLDYVKDYVVDKYGEAILAGGYAIYTTIDRDLQEHAKRVMEKGILRVARANGIPALPADYYQAEKMYKEQKVEIKPGKVLIGKIKDVKGGEYIIEIGQEELTAEKGELTFEKGDFVFVRFYRDKKELRWEVLPDLQGALVALDAKTGAIRAMVGGYSYMRSPYNRAVYARRQPGSAIKPVIYLSALIKGYTQASIIDASPQSFYDPSTGKDWTPKNYEGADYGPVSLRTALAKSINTATVNLLAEIGFDTPIEVGRLLGLDLKPYYSMALGSIETTPLQLTSAYQSFASLGLKCEPYFVVKIVSADGKVLEQNGPRCEQVLPPQETRVLVDMLRAVVLEGTGASASFIQRYVAGKTGTTNDYMDAWFIGFTPDLVAGVWVGFDLKRSMGRGMAGSRVALPIWIDFMSVAAYMFPKEDFPVPDGVVFLECPKYMAFVSGTEGVCGQEQQKEQTDELEGIVDPKFLREQPNVKEIP